ncbi:MAG: metallophosphoesterase [Deltaproteobacteria bacterium]|nr:metallophosphoesterase [Deltaproteobacteria bacterium]MDQ3299268.1 metallophosphoesterase [Myxococcota bacterium]
MRLAHCSDLHLLSHDGARWLDLANKRWIGVMNLLSSRSRHYHVAAFEAMVEDLNAQGIEHVLCTGDVTNLALRQEFEFARRKFDKLALGPLDVTVIPGNHDAYVAQGVPLFSETFGDYATPDAGWAWEEDHRHSADDILHWPIVRVRGELAIIGLSTSRATPWFTAYGSLGHGQLKRLRHVLLDERLSGKIRVIAIHHPPAGNRARSKIRGLRDHLAFAHVIAEAGADLIVHGHEHVDLVETLAGPEGVHVPVRGVASGTYFHNKPDRTARYRIYDMAGGQITGDHVRVWDPENRRFAPGEPTRPVDAAPARQQSAI